MLYSLLFGEGVVNDATSVVLLLAVASFNKYRDQAAYMGLLGILGNFTYLFTLSLLVGVGVGIL